MKKILEFDPRIVIPGHHDEAKLRIMEEAQNDSSRTYTECIDWSLKYLDVYEEAYNTAKNGAELVEKVNKYYGGVKAADFNIQWQAQLLFPRTAPKWLLPLPGPPGKIFLNPNGVYDGDPPKE